MVISSLFVLLGLVLLVWGGNSVVGGAGNIARHFGISELVVGLTVVSVGTSAPELAVSIMAAIEGHSAIALGNAVGSNLFNLFVVLALAGVVAPITVGRDEMRRDIPISLLCTLLLLLLGNEFFLPSVADEMTISRLDGVLLVSLLVGYVLLLVFQARSTSGVEAEADVTASPDISILRSVVLLVVGIASLIVGGRFVLNGSVDIATRLGVSERVIGLTIVAAGTSLPELGTSIVASRSGHVDMAFGNALGSNIFNILLILGVSASISPMPYDPTLNFDVFFLLGGTVALFGFVALSKHHRLERWQAALFFIAYVAYVVKMIIF